MASWSGSDRRRTSASADLHDRTSELRQSIEAAGYYPEIVVEGLRDAVAGEDVLAFVVHHEPTFERDEIRRHLTVVVMTPTRLVLGHTDEHSPDDLLPQPYTSTTTEIVDLSSVSSVVVTRMVPTTPDRRVTAPAEAVVTVSWGNVQRVDLEPAQCDDPSCEGDHGYTGTVTGDDFSLRVSAAADGGEAVERLLDFARRLTAETARSRTPAG